MNHILRPFLRRSVVVFLDDILIFSRSWQDNLKHLNEVLSALEQENCSLSLPSAFLLLPRLNFWATW